MVRKNHRRAVIIVFTIILLCFALSGAARSAEAIRYSDDEALLISNDSFRHFEAAKRSLRLQTELPADVVTPRAEDWKIFNFSIKGLEGLPRLILIISIVTIIAVVLHNLKDNLWSRSRARRLKFENDEKEPDAETAARIEIASAEADDLAGAGSFAEAIHVLLIRSVDEMKRRLNNPIAESLTSREILQNADLSPKMRDMFATLVDSVEISRFGSHQPKEEEYAECRGNFDALAALLRNDLR